MSPDVTQRSARSASDDDALSSLGQDISACDREPIHVPGSIQPHGLLLIVDPGTMRIVGGAGDLEVRLHADWLDAPVDHLLGDGAAARLGTASAATILFDRLPTAPALIAVARRGDPHWLVQIEASGGLASSPAAMLTWLDEAAGMLERAPDLLGLCHESAQLFRRITGFDRVMVYRFLDDDSGVVIAEDRADDLGSFLNHHFPASDIPRQARALYIRNRVRVIPDVCYTPEPIRPVEAELGGIDLSDVDVRSVSPIHLQYLRNMGVGASASISIVKDGCCGG